MKNFTSVNDVSDVKMLVKEAIALKKQPIDFQFAVGKTLGLIFFNPSLRTRMSSQKAAYNLGMNVIVLNINEDGWQIELEDGAIMDQGSQEHIKDAVKVISQYCDVLGVRTFAGLTDRDADYSEIVLNKFLAYSDVPVISLESATLHPLQSLADLMTIYEQGIEKPKIVVSWAPHPRALPQAVTNSFIQWIQQMEVNVVITHPKEYGLDPKITNGMNILSDQDTALEGADFVYAKNWSTFQPYGKVLSQDRNWTITSEKMARTNQGRFMHCLPIRRNVIASDSVVDSSLVIKQAENRIYAAQIVLKKILASGR